MKKVLVYLLTIIMILSLTLAFAGCKKGDEPLDKPADKPAKDKTVKKDEKVELQFIDFCPSPQREEFYTAMMEGYNEENPNVTIEYGSVPYEEAVNKLTVLGAAQKLPDIVNIHESVKWQFVPSGWLVDLTPYIDAIDGYEESFVATIRDFMWKSEKEGLGGIYTMPDGVMTNGIFIRKDWVEEAAMSLDELKKDWTWETYIDTVYALTDQSKNRYGISYRGGAAAFDRIQQYLVAYTGGYDFDKEGNCLYYTPENVERVEKFIAMYKDGCGPEDSINWGFVEMVDNFTGGLTATLNNDTEVVATCLDRMEDSQWAIMPLPKSSVDGKTYTYAAAAYNYGVSAFSDYPDEAWGFLEYISRPKNNEQYCTMQTMIPVRVDTENPFFSQDGPLGGFVTQINSDNFAYGPAYGGFIDVADWRSTAHVEFQKVLQGTKTVDEVLKAYDEELTKRAKQWLKDNPGKELGKVETLNGTIEYDGPSGEH